MSTVKERVIATVIERLGLEQRDIKTEAKFVDDLGADSLGIVELVMALEEEFDIEISDEAAEKIMTVQDAIDYVEQHYRQA